MFDWFHLLHSSVLFCMIVSSTVFGGNLVSWWDRKIIVKKKITLWASVLHLPSSGGTIKFKFFFAWMGQIFFIVCRSSMSAWSISSAGLIFMHRFSLIRANNVVVKWTCREMRHIAMLGTDKEHQWKVMFGKTAGFCEDSVWRCEGGERTWPSVYQYIWT